MFKHKINKNVILEGKTYIPQNGIVELPVIDKRYNPIEEIKTDENKDDLIEEAHKLGLGSPSTLKRLNPETLKKRIKEA